MAFNKTKALAAADKYIAKSNYNKALNELLKIIKVTPNDINLINKIGDLYSKTGKNQHAVQYFLKVAESHQAGGFNLKAIAVLKKVIRIDPTYMDARDRLVGLYIQQGHHSEAKGELRSMAEHYYAENLLGRALSCYEKMVEVDPSNLDARIKITEMLVREGRREEATAHFVAMGRELLQKKLVHEAQKIIGQGLKISPQNTDLLVLLAQTYLAVGKTEEALRQLTDICSKNEDDLNAIKILGETYLSKGQFKDAAACFLRALHVSEDETEPLEEVARELIEQGALDEAYEVLVPVSEIFVSRGEYEEATRVFRSILYADENHVPSQEMLVKIYEESQQNANAILALEKVINHFMTNRQTDEAVKRIRKLLELDPNNLEWRSRLESISGESFEGSSPDVTGIHMIEDQSMDIVAADLEGVSEELDSVDTQESLEPDDLQTKIANHLTEAEVFLKYGVMEKAAAHLMAVKELDFLNVEANTKLKQIFIDRNDIDNAVGCMVSLLNANIDGKDFQKAGAIIREIGEFRPEIAQMHQDRLTTLIKASGQNAGRDGDFDANLGSDAMEAEPTGNFMIEDVASKDVVDFRELHQGEAPSPIAETQASDSKGGWSLDIPKADAPAEGGRAEDLKDLYQVEYTGNDESHIALEPKTEDEEESQLEELAVSELEDVEPEDEPTPPEPVEAVAEKTPEPPPKMAPLGSAQGSLAGELEEIDFFISVEAYEDARNLIAEARERFGEHPLILEREQEVEAKTQEASQMPVGFPTPKPSAEPKESLNIDSGTGFFDLAAELNEELFEEELRDVNDNVMQEDIQSVEELFQEFKKGVDEQIDESDHQTHYDLGIAYKEMGLLEEAILEFEKARKDRSRFLECNTMIGNCMIELGRTETAIEHYQVALNDAAVTAEERIALLYEQALAFEGLGELEKALQVFMEIKKLDPDYRDLEDRIEALV